VGGPAHSCAGRYFSQDAPTKWVRYAAQLVAFAKVPLAADAPATPFSLDVRVRDMEGWDDEVGDYVVFAGNYTLALGLSAGDAAEGKHVFAAIAVAGTPWCRPSFPGAPPCTPTQPASA
jgi:hypothetical protein